MEFAVEDLSPVSKRINVTVSPEEMAAAIKVAVYDLRPGAKAKGYRPGKVPDAVIEQVHRGTVHRNAIDSLISVHAGEIAKDLPFLPITAFQLEGEFPKVVKGSPYVYHLRCEAMPVLDLPPYEGMEVEVTKDVVSDEVVDAIIDRMRYSRANFVPIEGAGPPVDDQLVSLGFNMVSKTDPSCSYGSETGELRVGVDDVVPAFDAQLKTMLCGQEKTFDMTLPENFVVKELSGHDVTCTIRLRSIKAAELPPLDDAFAKTYGHSDMAALRKWTLEDCQRQVEQFSRDSAKMKMVRELVKDIKVPMPPAKLNRMLRENVQRFLLRWQRAEKDKEFSDEEVRAVYQECLPTTQGDIATTAVLVNIARREGLSVTDDEVRQHVYERARNSGMDFNETYAALEKSGQLFDMRDNILADKGGDWLYERAKVTFVAPETPLHLPGRGAQDAPAAEGAAADAPSPGDGSPTPGDVRPGGEGAGQPSGEAV